MNIEVLCEFCDLAQTHSFSQTAKHFYVTQSALSKHIASLEKELEAVLFLRANNGIELTRVGEVFLPEAKKIIADYSKALSCIRKFRDGESLEIWLGYLYGAAKSFLPEALSAFSMQQPDVHVEFKAMEIDDIVNALLDDEIDIAITTGVFDFPERYGSRDLFPDEICLIAPSTHELSERSFVRIEDLVNRDDVLLPYIGIDAPESTALRSLLGMNAAMPRERRAHSNLMVTETMFLYENNALLTYGHILLHMSNKELRRIPFDSSLPSFSIKIVWNRQRETPALLSLIDEVVTSTAKLPHH